MDKLFYGLLFLLLDTALPLGKATVDVLPDFVGCVFLMQAAAGLGQKSEKLERIWPWAGGLLILTLATWTANLFDLKIKVALVFWVIGLVGFAAEALVLRWSIAGLRQLESQEKVTLGCEKMSPLWLVWVVLGTMAQVMKALPVVGDVALVAMDILAVCFLVVLYQGKKTWQNRT